MQHLQQLFFVNNWLRNYYSFYLQHFATDLFVSKFGCKLWLTNSFTVSWKISFYHQVLQQLNAASNNWKYWLKVINHIGLDAKPFTRSRVLHMLIATGEIKLGGNKKLKIYGTLNCASGKRMKIENRVFFKNEEEAIANNYRPCGNCLAAEYKIWKKNDGTIWTR